MSLLHELEAYKSIDFCESNYVHSPYIAEFWNTISSLFMTIVGLYSAYGAIKKRQELRFVICHLALAVIGIGSAAFHATLTATGQAFDELPMVWSALAVLFVTLCDDKVPTRSNLKTFSSRNLAIGLFSFGVVFTGAYLVNQHFVMLLVVFASCTVYTFYRFWRYSIPKQCKDCKSLPQDVVCQPTQEACGSSKTLSTQQRILAFTTFLYFSAFLMWAIGELACDATQHLQLHAWWHVFCGIAGHFGIVYLCLNRSRLLLRKAEIDHNTLYVLPVVHIHGLSSPKTKSESNCSCGGNSDKLGSPTAVRASGYLDAELSPRRRGSAVRAEFSPLISPRSRAKLGQLTKFLSSTSFFSF